MSTPQKTAFISGGTKGIGLGIAKALIQDGYRVAFSSRKQKDADDIAALLNEFKPDSAAGFEADVRDHKAQQKIADELLKQWGRVDVLVANAGVGHMADIEQLTDAQWHDTIDTNLTGVFHSVKAFLPALKKSEGYIITIASLAGANFFEKGTAYNASKFGLVGFSQALMLDVRKHNIKVTTIMPGSVATHFNDHTPTEADAWKIQPEDIGQLVTDLLHMHPRTPVSYTHLTLPTICSV